MSSSKDVFLCHASEDKDPFVRPLAAEFERRGITYWLDEAEVKWGDRITQKINEGLRGSRYVIVFLSSNFMGKNWPESELGAALSKENGDGQTFVLPLMVAESGLVMNQYPLLREKACLTWASGISGIVDQLERVLLSQTAANRQTEAPLWKLGPTLAEILNSEDVDSDLMSSLSRFLKANRQLQKPDLLVSDLMDQLPEELKEPVSRLVAKHENKTSTILAAIRQEPLSDGSLEIISVTATREAEFDVKLRNLSTDTIYITRIVLRVLKDEGIVLPVLSPSARYEIPIGFLGVGEAKSLDVSHVIEPHRADRFLIALQSTRVLHVRVTFEYNKRYSVSENAWLWKNMQETADDVLRREASRVSWERWSAATPSCLKRFENEMADVFSSVSLPTLLSVLEAAYPNRNTRIRALLAWFGSGAGPWTGFPAYESIAENLLMTFPLDDLLSSLEIAELTDSQLEGAARLFAGWAFGTKRRQELALLPEPTRKRSSNIRWPQLILTSDRGPRQLLARANVHVLPLAVICAAVNSSPLESRRCDHVHAVPFAAHSTLKSARIRNGVSQSHRTEFLEGKAMPVDNSPCHQKPCGSRFGEDSVSYQLSVPAYANNSVTPVHWRASA
jgi:hypothetical protein